MASVIGKAVHKSFDSDNHIANLDGVGSVTSTKAARRSPVVAERLAAIERDGFVVIEDVLSPEQVQNIRRGIEAEMGPLGRNNFEGTKTQRVYAMCSKQRKVVDGKSVSVFDDVVLAPKVIELMDELLLPNYLLTAYQAIHIQPGESRQPYHHDDQFCNVPRPRASLSYAAIYAIDDFTAENGGTIVFPGSHKWGNELPPKDNPDGTSKGVPAVMKAGSAIVFAGALWHAGGPNTSTTGKHRMAVTTQYCQPWMRPQENFLLSMPFEQVKQLPPALQSLIGYNIHPPFVGHVNGEHPLKRVDQLSRSKL